MKTYIDFADNHEGEIIMKLEKSHYWKAVVEIEANNIAFSTVVNIHRKGMRIDHTELA